MSFILHPITAQFFNFSSHMIIWYSAEKNQFTNFSGFVTFAIRDSYRNIGIRDSSMFCAMFRSIFGESASAFKILSQLTGPNSLGLNRCESSCCLIYLSSISAISFSFFLVFSTTYRHLKIFTGPTSNVSGSLCCILT